MKVAVCAKNNNGLESEVDERFGRAEYYVVFDTETKDVKTIENSAKNDSQGAGGKAVSIINENGVDTVIVPELGPKAVTALEAFEISAFQIDNSKNVDEVIKSFLNGKLQKMNTSSVNEHSGLRKA